jgi:hypothetical protein
MTRGDVITQKLSRAGYVRVIVYIAQNKTILSLWMNIEFDISEIGGFWEWKALFNQKNKVDEKVVRKYLDFLIY